MRVLLLFVDGIGLAPPSTDTNPLSVADMPATRRLLTGGKLVAPLSDEPDWPLVALDATLGVPGLPQSGTGQSSLLTGTNAARQIGRHHGPYPGAELRPLLESHSLWKRLTDQGLSVALANVYPDEYLSRVRRGTGRMGAMARSAHLAGVRLRGPEDLRQGRGASAFLTNELWQTRLGYADIARVTEQEAGVSVAGVARDHDFTVFEYYATDIAGHRMDMVGGVAALEAYDRFVAGAMSAISTSDVLVVVSDHGNLEDISTRRHTTNPAVCIWHGPRPTAPLSDLTDVAPGIMDLIGGACD